MMPSWVRAAAAAALSAAAGAACLVAVYASRPALVLEMDRELPRRTASGIYPPERDGVRSFAWTGARADLRFPGLDRDAAWACAIVFRGARRDPAAQPIVEVAVDGITIGRRAATNAYESLEVTAPARVRHRGLTLTITSSPTLVPDPPDRRELGIQVDRFSCRPLEGTPLPPRAAIQAAMLGSAALGAALGLWLPFVTALTGTALLSIAQALPLASGTAPYGEFPSTAAGAAVWIAAAMAISVKIFELATRGALPDAARFVLLFSGSMLYLKLLGLLHPSKLVIDALFHAHRFQAVLAGDYFFTQIMPSGVTFPYAVGLYVVAAPWAAFTRDHVMLLRIVVTAAEVVAGALLYLVIVKAWSDRLAGAVAVVLYHTVALPYGLIGNANLTNAFGQSVALAALVLAATLAHSGRRLFVAGALFAAASLAFLTHISTAAQLGTTLVTLASLSWFLGSSALRRSAITILLVTILAAGCAWGLYYGRFTEVYATALERVRSSGPTSPGAAEAEPATAASARPQSPRAGPTLVERTAHALAMTATAIGWPVVILAIVGLWDVWRRGTRDGLLLLLGAWGLTYAVFLGIAVLPRVEAPFQRYAAEFVGRVVFATYPAVVILAARGAVWGFRSGAMPLVGSAATVLWAVVIASYQWRGWFD